MKELEPIQASFQEVTGQVNQGIVVEALKNQMFTTPEDNNGRQEERKQ